MNDDNTTTTTETDPTAQKAPDAWVTGDEPMTGAQRSYLETLATEVGREIPEEMTKAGASRLIDELQADSDRVDG